MCRAYTQGNIQNLQQAILENKISINEGCPYPFLAYSSKIGDITMVKWLLTHGANVNQDFVYQHPKTKPYIIRHTPLYYTLNAEKEARKINYQSYITPKFIRCIEILLAHGADLNYPCGKYQKSTDKRLKGISLEIQTPLQLLQSLHHPVLDSLINGK